MISRFTLTILVFLGLFSCERFSQKEYYDKIVHDAYNRKYDGFVIEKYIAKSRARPTIVLETMFGKDKIDFVFQNDEIFEFIQLGDTLLKERKTLSIEIKRKDFDTIINLDFKKIKGYEIYSKTNPYISN